MLYIVLYYNILHKTSATPSPRPPSLRWQATAAPCGPFQAWTKPLHPGQAWAQPLRGSGLAHPFHCKTSQPLPVDNCKQLPTAIDCHQFFKNSSFWESKQPPLRGLKCWPERGQKTPLSDMVRGGLDRIAQKKAEKSSFIHCPVAFAELLCSFGAAPHGFGHFCPAHAFLA